MSSYIILTNKNTGERKMKTPYIALKKGKTRNWKMGKDILFKTWRVQT